MLERMQKTALCFLLFASLGLNAQETIQKAQPFVDARDGEIYQTITFDNQRWFSENLRYNVPNVTTNKESIDTTLSETELKHYGRLYDWATLMNVTNNFNKEGFFPSSKNIQGICPKGWHIPTDEEWKVLERALGMKESLITAVLRDRFVDNFERVVSPVDWITSNDNKATSLLNIFPTGAYKSNDSRKKSPGFDYLGERATFWTASEISDENAWGRSIIYSSNAFSRYNKYQKQMGYSCRCAED